jgi:hypothetical protein
MLLFIRGMRKHLHLGTGAGIHSINQIGRTNVASPLPRRSQTDLMRYSSVVFTKIDYRYLRVGAAPRPQGGVEQAPQTLSEGGAWDASSRMSPSTASNPFLCARGLHNVGALFHPAGGRGWPG